MTKEEAIEFGNMWLEVNADCKDSNTYEFFKIALEALKKESYEDVIKKDCGNCAYYDNGANDEACNGCFEDEEHLNFKPKAQYYEDCISRKAVLNGLASIAKVKARSDAQKSLMGRSMFFVEQLSPVTPQPKIGHWIYDEKSRVTNGDMIKAMFPNIKYEENGNSTTLYFDKKIGTIVTHDFWNASYKAESEK